MAFLAALPVLAQERPESILPPGFGEEVDRYCVLELERVRDPRRRPLLVVVTDGRATAGPGAVERSRLAARLLAAHNVGAVVIDCENGAMRLGLARTLAEHLRAEHMPVADVSVSALTHTVQERVA